MTQTSSQLIGATAAQIATRVRARDVSPVEVVSAHLERITALDGPIGAFQVVRHERAVAEAADLMRRDDLAALPLAGVPIAIKDSLDVAGEPSRQGCAATSSAPKSSDHEVVRRLRDAGAIVVGKTKVPQFCLWAWTDSVFGVTRSPWDLTRTSGGSSGGSAAAVSAGMVPLAQGSDGGGSIRIPSACCGVVGIKPGLGVIPPSPDNWYGLSELGPLATTVEDIALALSAMSAQPYRFEPAPDRPLRVALSVKPSFAGPKVHPEYDAAARNVAELLAHDGHEVEEADPSYDVNVMLTAVTRAYRGAADIAAGLRLRELEKRNRVAIGLGRLFGRRNWLRDDGRRRWCDSVASFFNSYDVLVTPTVATPPIEAKAWSERGFLANISQASFAPFTNAWNVAGVPAVAVPAGLSGSGFPLSVQVVGPEGSEQTLLAVAARIQSLVPTPRHAPSYSV